MKRATITDVAELAGVSRSAVSKVLRNAYGISDEMRRCVEKAMQELSYRPQIAARGLRGSTFTLGVVMPDMRNAFFSDIMDGVWDALHKTPYQPLHAIRPAAEATERPLIERMRDHKIDGFIMIAPLLEHHYLWQLAAAVPTVVIGRHESGGGFDTVNNDDELGARLVVDHLVAQGHQRIAYFNLASPEDTAVNPAVFRLKGYLDAMREKGLARHIFIRDGNIRAGESNNRAIALDMLQGENRPTAVFGWSDKVALTVLSVANELGMRIPEDVAVVGYDNSQLCNVSQISLTSIDQGGNLLGAEAAELLIQRIEGRADEVHFVTPPKLVVRKSSSFRRSN